MSAFRRGCSGCLVVIIGIVLCSGTMFFTFDRIRSSNLPERLPQYPNATVRRMYNNFVTPWGVGNTVLIMDTDDEPDVVRAWYGRHVGTFLRAALQSDSPMYTVAQRIARADWAVERAEDGTGSMITLLGTCVNN